MKYFSNFIMVLVLSLTPLLVNAQGVGGSRKPGKSSKHMTEQTIKRHGRNQSQNKRSYYQQTIHQDKSYTFSETFGDTTYQYSVKIFDGKLTVRLTSPAENYHETGECNPEIDPDIIFAELKGIIYWGYANKYFWFLAEELGHYRYDEYQWAKRALSKSASSFAEARHYCPSAYKKVLSLYTDLIDAENSVGQLWDEITLLSYALGEHPIEACDIY